MELLQSVLYIFMISLLYPVVVLLISALCLVFYMFGSFVYEYSFRRKTAVDAESLAACLTAQFSGGQRIQAANLTLPPVNKVLRGFVMDLRAEISRGVENLDIRTEGLLQHYEIGTARMLDRTRILVRVGPILGLMGTLIPIGGALLALSLGDFEEMSNKLIVAFSTTVLGLAIGGVSYVMSIARERWFESDTCDMAIIAEYVLRAFPHDKKRMSDALFEKEKVV